MQQGQLLCRAMQGKKDCRVTCPRKVCQQLISLTLCPRLNRAMQFLIARGFHYYPYSRGEITAEPKQLQSMLLTLQNYSLKVVNRPGPDVYINNTLSRANTPPEPWDMQYTHHCRHRKIDQVDYLNVNTWHKSKNKGKGLRSLEAWVFGPAGLSWRADPNNDQRMLVYQR